MDGAEQGGLDEGASAQDNALEVVLGEWATILTEKPFSFPPENNILPALHFPMFNCKMDAQQCDR
jgi:hypothetical protein